MGKLGEWEVFAVARLGGRAAGGIDLYEGDLRSFVFQIVEALDICADFLLIGRFVFENGEDALDNHGAPLRCDQDVPERGLHEGLRAVDPVHVFLGSGVELDPDFVVGTEPVEPALYGGPMEPGAVGDDHDFERGKHLPDEEHFFDDLVEVGDQAWFTVTAQCHFFQCEEFGWSRRELFQFVHASALGEGNDMDQLPCEHFEVELQVGHFRRAHDFAVGAVVIARLVGVHVDADGEPACAGTDHGIDKAVANKFSGKGAIGAEVGRGHLIHSIQGLYCTSMRRA